MAARCVSGLICLMVVLTAARSAVADVTVQASATGVQKGGDITFTATADESDPVVKVTFTYEGTTASDEDTTSPYQVTRAMDWTTLQDLAVTATFDFQNITDQQGTVEVDVVDITLLGPATPTRMTTACWLARTSPTGLSVSTWSWLYDNDLLDVTWDDTANSDYLSPWLGTVVISGTIQTSATILGVACTKSMNINVKPRPYTTWTMPLACVEDNEATWGLPPIDQDISFGRIEDRESNTTRIIVPQGTDENWADGVTLSQVSSGPNAGLWYVRFNTLEIDMETVINQHIKADAPPPDVGEDNFFDHNNGLYGGCIANDMADFVQAVKNHEYRGTPPTEKSLEGHFGRIEHEFDQMGDPLPTIEALLATSESALLTAINDELGNVEAFLWMFTGHGAWSQAGPNWGGTGSLGSGKHDRYNLQGGYTSGCEWGPDWF
ncbi:MAG TPA: hypothetical protein VMZ31_03120 [Phycisphaerae bacterium]|nr:hypothetical protein [Phycisphaerae bacterium]